MFDRFKGKDTCFLVFHRVVKPTQKHKNYSSPPTALDVTVFEEIINIIAKKCCPLSIDEALYKIKRHRLSPKTFVITFDDGYLDNYEIALPILHRYQVPAIIYITSGFIDSSVYPFEYQLASIVSSKKEITVQAAVNTSLPANKYFCFFPHNVLPLHCTPSPLHNVIHYSV